MKPGTASQTAVLVCMARAMAHAMAHATTEVTRFSDPTALALLPDAARARVERFQGGAPPQTARERIERRFLVGRSQMMVARTVAVDDAVRAVSSPQVVILGAGLDGRAWRMPELRDAVVFEVDHPDSQRGKRARVGALTQAARDVRFVPVDFTRDRLDEALAAAGHDPAQPTTWIWEGVVLYLTRSDVEVTLDAVARRSAANSRIIVVYASPALILAVVALLVRRLGEPLRSAYTADQMRSVLAKYGFAVVRDETIATIGAALSPQLAKATKVMKHLRVATADKATS